MRTALAVALVAAGLWLLLLAPPDAPFHLASAEVAASRSWNAALDAFERGDLAAAEEHAERAAAGDRRHRARRDALLGRIAHDRARRAEARARLSPAPNPAAWAAPLVLYHEAWRHAQRAALADDDAARRDAERAWLGYLRSRAARAEAEALAPEKRRVPRPDPRALRAEEGEGRDEADPDDALGEDAVELLRERLAQRERDKLALRRRLREAAAEAAPEIDR